MIQTREFNGQLFHVPAIVMHALEESDRTLSEIFHMTPKERFAAYLEWEGIIHYDAQIWEAVEESLQTEKENKK